MKTKTPKTENKAARTEAVEIGCAELVTDSSGRTTFKWKEVAK